MARWDMVEGRPIYLWRQGITGARMRILMLNSEIPFPPITGAQSRTYHLLKGLSAEHDVTLIGFTWDSHDSPIICSLPVEGISVPWDLSEPYRKMREGDPSVSQAAYRHLASETAQPWFVSYYNSPTMPGYLAAWLARSFASILVGPSSLPRRFPCLRPP